MKGKKVTYQQRKILEKAGLDPTEYLVQKIKSDRLQLIHRSTGEIKEVMTKEDK